MDYVFFFGGVALMWAMWRASRPQPLFTVRVNEDQAAAIVGTVTPAFLERVREVAANHEQSHGEIRGYPNEQQIRLQFSSEFPESARQQMRNWWMIHGWPAPRHD